MSGQAKVVAINQSGCEKQTVQEVCLESGRQVRIRPDGSDDIFEIVEPAGNIVIQIKLTAEGPVISAQSARLRIKAPECLSLESRRVEIKSETETVMESKGSIQLVSDSDMNLNAGKDIKINGEMIHLN